MKGTLFVFVQLITAIVCGGDCPPGLLWYPKVSNCCQPVTHCGPGHQVKPCTEVGKRDSCVPCPMGQTNVFNTSSFDIKACKVNKCPSDTAFDKDGKCVCNLLEGYTGENPKLCLNEGQLCPKGKELQLDGDCKPCAYGFYKDWEGYGFCKKQIDCKLLQLEYKVTGNFQAAAICKKPPPDYKVVDDSSKRMESQTLSAYPSMTDIIKNPEPQPNSDFKSEHLKSEQIHNKNIFTCDFQIIVVVLGVLLFISSAVIVYFIIARKSAAKKKTNMSAVPLKRNISEVSWCNNRSQRPLPILPRHETYCTPDVDQYIPMDASRHPSCSNTSRQEHTFQQQEDSNDDSMYQENNPYMPTPLNESAYVKIEPLSFNYVI